MATDLIVAPTQGETCTSHYSEIVLSIVTPKKLVVSKTFVVSAVSDVMINNINSRVKKW